MSEAHRSEFQRTMVMSVGIRCDGLMCYYPGMTPWERDELVL